MPKVNRNGQAEIFTETDQRKVLAQFRKKSHRLIFAIATLTGERWGAIRQLRVNDVYENPIKKLTRSEILFPAAIRKADPNGDRTSRSVPIHPDLARELEKYTPPLSGYLFPGRNAGKPITDRALDLALREALRKSGLKTRGYSTHSTRRTMITRLHRGGANLKDIQDITGHKSLSALERYVESDPDRKKKTISGLYL